MKLKKIHKKTKKFFEDIFEEGQDFFDDIKKDILKKPKKISKRLRSINLYGSTILVSPAYLFAQKIDSLLKIIFGFSILISSLLASFWGYTRTSELLEALIVSAPGRVFIFIIGFSFLILGVWKLFNLK